MLAADPDAGLEMFSAMDPPLPAAAVLAMLTSYAPQLAGAYLETALAQVSSLHSSCRGLCCRGQRSWLLLPPPVAAQSIHRPSAHPPALALCLN